MIDDNDDAANDLDDEEEEKTVHCFFSVAEVMELVCECFLWMIMIDLAVQ
jgi:hypothetical protein